MSEILTPLACAVLLGRQVRAYCSDGSVRYGTVKLVEYGTSRRLPTDGVRLLFGNDDEDLDATIHYAHQIDEIEDVS